jgi:hypothetical protein
MHVQYSYYWKRVKNMDQETTELSKEEKIQILKDINASYDELIALLEQLKIEQLKSEIK